MSSNKQANTTLFQCPPQPHGTAFYTGPLSSEQPNSYFKIPAQRLINDADGGFLSSSRPLFSDLTLGPQRLAMVELHQPPKPLCVNTPCSPVHTSECWHCPRPGAERQAPGGVQERQGCSPGGKGKKASRLQSDWEVASPPQGHKLPFPYSFSPHSLPTGLRK